MRSPYPGNPGALTTLLSPLLSSTSDNLITLDNIIAPNVAFALKKVVWFLHLY
jgi:hypothetical protein